MNKERAISEKTKITFGFVGVIVAGMFSLGQAYVRIDHLEKAQERYETAVASIDGKLSGIDHRLSFIEGAILGNKK